MTRALYLPRCMSSCWVVQDVQNLSWQPKPQVDLVLVVASKNMKGTIQPVIPGTLYPMTPMGKSQAQPPGLGSEIGSPGVPDCSIWWVGGGLASILIACIRHKPVTPSLHPVAKPPRPSKSVRAHNRSLDVFRDAESFLESQNSGLDGTDSPRVMRSSNCKSEFQVQDLEFRVGFRP